MSSDLYTMEYPKDGSLQEAVKSGNVEAVGKHYHKELLGVLEMNQIPPQIIMALSDDRILVGSVDYPTHEERCYQSLVTGRAFIEQFKDEPINCLVMMTAGVSTSADSGVKPNDDPEREYVAVTQALNLKPLHAATTLDEYINAHKKWDSRVWFDQHHEGLVINSVFDGVKVIPYNSTKEIDLDDKSVARFDNPNLTQCLVGISSNFAVIRDLSKDKTKDDIDLEFAPLFLEKGMDHEVTYRTRLRLAAKEMKDQMKPTKLEDCVQVSDLSDHTVEVMECFGVNAASILNDYATAIEDLLLTSREQTRVALMELHQLQQFKDQTLASINSVMSNKN